MIVDFLMPRDAEIMRNVPPLLSEFAVQRADGAELALRFYQMVAIAGNMPSGGVNRVEIAVCSIPALLAMKGHAVNGRYKQKDSYDIYYCIRNYPDGIERLAQDCRPLLEHASAARGFGFVAEKFDRPDAYGPTYWEAAHLTNESLAEGSLIVLGDVQGGKWRERTSRGRIQ